MFLLKGAYRNRINFKSSKITIQIKYRLVTPDTALVRILKLFLRNKIRFRNSVVKISRF